MMLKLDVAERKRVDLSVKIYVYIYIYIYIYSACKGGGKGRDAPLRNLGGAAGLRTVEEGRRVDAGPVDRP